MRFSKARVALLAAAVSAVCAVPALAAFQDEEPANYAKTNEREQYQTSDPAFQARLAQAGAESKVEEAEILTDTERRAQGNLCFQHADGCAGDVRFYDWDQQPGHIRVGPILWTARSGATISGHVWATEGGPARKPGIVITNGSVQAPEQLYWAQAAVLAQAGYVVLTWDPQTQGRSDGPGAAPTEDENAQPQTPEAFTEGGVDALDFFLSTPEQPFHPRNSRTQPAVNHSPKQDRRVAEGRNAAFNPLHAMVDPARIGIAGNSLGAFAVSKVASEDPRVDALVAWDQLTVDGRGPGGGPSMPIAPRVPGLGMSGDYGIGSPNGAAGVNPKPRESAPDPQGANGPSRTFSEAGVPTMQVNTRAGTHFESAVIPNAGFPATLRGNDMTAWYTTAWFDRFVKGDPTADARLLTDRWQADPRDAQIDPAGQGNLFSPSLRSRIDILRADGTRALCEDLRNGCGILGPDGAGPFSADGRPVQARRRCATAVRTRRRVDLSRSGRRLHVKLRVLLPSRVTVRVKGPGAKRRGVRRTRTRVPGARTVRLRLPRRARPGRYRVGVTVRCGGHREIRVRRARVVR